MRYDLVSGSGYPPLPLLLPPVLPLDPPPGPLEPDGPGAPEGPGAPDGPGAPEGPGAPDGPGAPAGPGAPDGPGVGTTIVLLLGGGVLDGVTTTGLGLAAIWLGEYQRKYPANRATTMIARTTAIGAHPESVESCVCTSI